MWSTVRAGPEQRCAADGGNEFLAGQATGERWCGAVLMGAFSARSTSTRSTSQSSARCWEVGEDAARLAHHRGTAVAFAIHDDQLAARPSLVDSPWPVEGTAHIEPPVNEPTGNIGEPSCTTQDLVRGEPGVVAPAMGDLAGKAEAKPRVVVA